VKYLGKVLLKCGFNRFSHQLILLTPLFLQCASARKSGGRGAASGWIASDFLDFLFLFRQRKRKEENFSIFFERSKKKQKNPSAAIELPTAMLSLKSLLQQGYVFPSHAHLAGEEGNPSCSDLWC
jgi:hypothetical protein